MDVSTRKYGRNDVDYGTWYSEWMKMLARTKMRAELEKMLGVASASGRSASRTHLRAIERTGSMTGRSQARAHARNLVAASGDTQIAVRGALEIHDLFPEHALGGE